ncbi:hypothetical protein BBJ28_00011375 [Nothophytophthora sp. Chile5]|nr:hypothetical protein BBJ28_00011375 [Nothophytophthora sp. Chile5]
MNGNASEVSATVDAIAPTDLHKAFAALYPHLCDGTQQDAQEFLVCLLGRLGDELKRHPTPKKLGELSILSPRSHALLSRLFSRSKEAEPKGSNDNDGAETDAGRLRFCMEDSNGRHDRLVATEWWVSHLVNEPSVVTALFSGQFKSVLTCDRCAHQSARFEPFSSLQLPLEDGADTEASSTLTDQEGSLLDVVVIVHFADSLQRRGGPRGALRLAVHVKRHAALADVLSQLPQTRRASDSTLSRRYVVGSLQGLTIDHLVVEEGVGNQLEADTPAISLPTPTHVFELTNIVGNGDDTAAPTVSSTPLYLRFLHRRTVLVPFYCTTPSRQALCGSPFVCCSVLGALTGQALYRVVRQRFQLGGDTPFAPRFSDPDRSPQSSRYTVTFMLRRVREDGVACSRCYWSSGCRGCRILPSTTAAELLDLGSHESIAIDWELHSDSQQLQTFWWLQVPPPTDDESYVRYRRIKTHPLMRSLHSLCSTEHLEAACSQCHPGVPTPHTKQLTLWSLPPLLVLQLKRFELSAGPGGNFHWKKLTQNVDFPIHGLDLSDRIAQVDGSHGDSEPCGPRCISGVVDTRVRRGLEFLQDELGVPLGSASRSCALYDLYAVVNHSGSGLSSGHYTAHVRSANSECWWLADDAKVTSMAAEELAPSTAAYLLFYVRRDVAAGAKDLSDLFPRRQDAPEAANAAGEAETPRPRRPAEQHRCVVQ